MKWAVACALVPFVAGNLLSEQVRSSLRQEVQVEKKVDGYMLAENKACQTSGPYWFHNTEDLAECTTETNENWNTNRKNSNDCRRWKKGTRQDCARICNERDDCVGFNYVHTGVHSGGFNRDGDGTCYFRNLKNGVNDLTASLRDNNKRDCYMKEPIGCQRAKLFAHCDNFMQVKVFNGQENSQNVKTIANTDGWRNGREIDFPVRHDTKVFIKCEDDGSTVAGLIAELHYNGGRISTKESTVGKYGDDDKLFELMDHQDKDENTIPIGGFDSWVFTPGNKGAWNPTMWNNVQKNGAYFQPDIKWFWPSGKLSESITMNVDVCTEYAKCMKMDPSACSTPAYGTRIDL